MRILCAGKQRRCDTTALGITIAEIFRGLDLSQQSCFDDIPPCLSALFFSQSLNNVCVIHYLFHQILAFLFLLY